MFASCNLLIQDLLLAKSELKLQKLLKRLSRFEAVIIDDIGYVQQNRQEMEVLFTLLAERYERGSVMLTSNLPFSKWEQLFKDPMTLESSIPFRRIDDSPHGFGRHRPPGAPQHHS